MIERRMVVYQIGDAMIAMNGKGKGKMGMTRNDLKSRVGTRNQRNRRIRRDQVGYKRGWDCTWNWRGII